MGQLVCADGPKYGVQSYIRRGLCMVGTCSLVEGGNHTIRAMIVLLPVCY